MTEDQLKSLLSGLVLGSHTNEEAADAPELRSDGAPAASPASETIGADGASSTTPSEVNEPPVPDAEPLDDSPAPEPTDELEPEPANDNAPMPDSQATGTE